MNPKIKEKLRTIRLILFILLLLLGILVLFVEWRYRAVFLSSPCELCVDLNPQYLECFNYAGLIIRDSEGNIVAEGKEAKDMIDQKKFLYPNYTINFNLSEMVVKE